MLFIVDEVAQLKRFGMLELARDTGREAGMRMLLPYQALGQLQGIWGKESADAWFASAAWTSFSAIADKATADLVSELCGEYPVLAWSDGRNSGSTSSAPFGGLSVGQTVTTSESKRRLIKPEELMHDVRTDEQFLHARGMPPARLGRPYAFRRREMAALLGRG